MTENKRVFVTLFITLCFIVIFGGIAYMNYDAFRSYLLRVEPNSPDCMQVNARITERAQSRGVRNDSSYLTYEYEVAGERYVKKERVDQYAYLLAKNHDAIQICYHKDKPYRSNIAISEEGILSLIKTVILDIILLLVFFMVYREAKKQAVNKEG